MVERESTRGRRNSPRRLKRDVIRVLLIDDHAAVRLGLRMRLELEPDIKVVGEAGEAWTGLALTRMLEPDVVLMDLVLPGIDGITATSLLYRDPTPVSVIILSLYADKAALVRARSAGAAAFLLKDTEISRLINTIRDVAAGDQERNSIPPRDEMPRAA